MIQQHEPQESLRRSARPRRAVTAALAVLAAVSVWSVARLIGIDVQSPEMGDRAAADITVFAVVAASAAASSAGWALLALLERITTRAWPVWLAAAGAFLAVSFAPVAGPGIGAANRAVLAALHLVVAAVLVQGFAGTAHSGKQREQEPVASRGKE